MAFPGSQFFSVFFPRDNVEIVSILTVRKHTISLLRFLKFAGTCGRSVALWKYIPQFIDKFPPNQCYTMRVGLYTNAPNQKANGEGRKKKKSAWAALVALLKDEPGVPIRITQGYDSWNTAVRTL